ncbi:hypothetical protein [Stenotrophomonas rhizophila]|uniref:hypothetical protein n=1 Tax=Stenotrophomonas rhizophila TaxID=216778 RepID=UPI00112F77A2|nr:hypothetical protein [Stenotrophomonas rhizophila]
MSMLDGVSQCWMLSSSCQINWDAWAAIGTVAAVFAAILGPSIQRRFVRRRANALFFFAHMGDVAATLTYLRTLNEVHPPGEDSAFPPEFLRALRSSKQAREQYREKVAAGVAPLAERSVDATKWPGIDMKNAALLAVAIEACRAVRVGSENLVDYRDDADFDKRVSGIRAGMTVALRSLAKVDSECGIATIQLFKEHV